MNPPGDELLEEARARRLCELGARMAEFSHDVRNSLAAILSLAELIESAGPETDRGALASKICHHARQCKELADDVLALHLREVARKQTALGDLIRIELQARPERAGIVIDLEMNDEVWVEVNPSRLRRVVANLLDNSCRAMMSTGGGRIVVRVERDGGGARLTVADDGPGVAADVAETMFDAWQSGARSTGLGLALCRRLVEDNGGTISHVPTDVGCTIAVEFPAVEPAEEAVSGANGRRPELDDYLRVLVVDDDETTLETYRMILELDGHDVTCVSTAAACLEHLAGETVDVVLADVRLRDLSGPELYRRIRSRDDGVARHIVFATGDLLSDATREFLNATGNPYLIKPFEIEELRSALVVAQGR